MVRLPNNRRRIISFIPIDTPFTQSFNPSLILPDYFYWVNIKEVDKNNKVYINKEFDIKEIKKAIEEFLRGVKDNQTIIFSPPKD
ncbi:MAG: hypothetical protein NC904_08830 [Candidatus Omnitrophica bacterium]|nr:hypothetical protein [Candidatus Omnitrophota bacterium]